MVEVAGSPVVEFSPGVFTGSKLTRGRAYFATDLRFRSELPAPDFLRWGNRVLARVKANLTRLPDIAPGTYFGGTAAQWIQDSGAGIDGGAVAFTSDGG